MSTKEKSIGFPRRLLSSLRRNKKSHFNRAENIKSESEHVVDLLDTHNEENETEESVLHSVPGVPDEQLDCEDENTSLLSPTETYSVLNEDVSVLEHVPHSLFRNLSTPTVRRADTRTHPAAASTPTVRRIELGGLISASTDSGIDCSVLISEKNSPEQFVAFTRREAERLRQEQQVIYLQCSAYVYNLKF